MYRSLYEFDVLINGSSAREHVHEGRTYIEGRNGSSFSLRMRNNSHERCLFVPTVDGLSIMDGKDGSYESRGYIVGAKDSITIRGWRTSDKDVAEFFFSSPGESYASKKGKGRNMGVIGCAVFKEKEKPVQVKIEKEYIPYPVYPNYPHPRYPAPERSPWYFGVDGTSNMSLYSAQAPTSFSLQNNAVGTSQAIGTGFGETKHSPVVTVEFDKTSSPDTTFLIYYNTRQELEKMGVIFNKPLYVTPRAFPKESNGDYCERP